MDSEKSESAAGRCRREQSVSDSKREVLHSVECGVWSHTVECSRAATWSLALVPSGIGSGATDAVVRLALVRAQSTLCSSKRQSAILPPWMT